MEPIKTMQAFVAKSLLAAGTADSPAIDLRYIISNYKFSIDYTITGTGTVKIEYLLCGTSDGTYVDIGTDLGATLGAGSSFLPFASGEPYLAPFMKIRVTEDGGAAAAVVSVNVHIQ